MQMVYISSLTYIHTMDVDGNSFECGWKPFETHTRDVEENYLKYYNYIIYTSGKWMVIV